MKEMSSLHIQGIVLLVLTIAYSGMVFYSLVNWNEVSLALVTGYALFAQSALSKVFALPSTPGEGSVSRTTTTTDNVDGIVATTPIK